MADEHHYWDFDQTGNVSLDHNQYSGNHVAPRPIDSKSISFDISWVISMTFDPLKQSLQVEAIAIFYPGKDVLDKILVFHSFASGCLPTILTPIPIPRCYTVYCIHAVRNDCNISVSRHDVKSSQYCGELSALICLTLTW